MENIVPDKYYDIADEYALESEEPVEEQEYDGLAHYFQLLITCLTNNEEISEEAQKRWRLKPVSINSVSMISLNFSTAGVMIKSLSAPDTKAGITVFLLSRPDVTDS